MIKKLTALILYCTITSQSFASMTDLEVSNHMFTGNSAEFIYKNYPTQELIQVKLLGAVKNSGIYHIPNKTSITTLLSLAGGVNETANTEKIIIGNVNNRKNKLINLEQILNNKTEQNDELNANDIVFVKNKAPLINNEITHSLSFISIFLTSILTAVVISEKTRK